ncbi:MAG: trypsin-like peptidase domain-containing protein [Ruminococcus sp.]|nr:trypsin-like peptidase domain-containing protein [Ruminococcus sp.]
MAEFENNNNNNGAYDGAEEPSQANGAAEGAAHSSNMGGTYPDYRSGYYRNPNPHQDEPIRSNGYTGVGNPSYGSGNAYRSESAAGSFGAGGYTNKTGSANGYNYANYYTNSNNIQSAENTEKKKSRKGLKIAALVTAAVFVVSISFVGGYSMNKGGRVSDAGKINYSDPSADSDDKNDSNNDNSAVQTGIAAAGVSKSLIELASRKDAITIPEIVNKMTPSVVGVQSTFVSTAQSNMPYSFGFGYFDFGNGGTQSKEAVGTGTGVVISQDGYIVTNAHVVYDSSSGYGVAQSVDIQMSDQETVYTAEIVAYDVESDLAVLKVDQTGLIPAEFGDSNECQVGELVVAIGNPLGLELQNTVTCGIISALNRQITINDKKMRLIQTDTAINSGNSGGPLINSAGQVVGINSAKMSSTYSSNNASIEGIGFAIPITEAKEIVDDLIEHGYVTGRPQLGIVCQDVSEAVSQAYNFPMGTCIISVTKNGAADKAGLQVQDFIIGIDGHTIKTSEELNDYKNEHDAGEQVVLTIVRQGQQMDVTVTLEESVAQTD